MQEEECLIFDKQNMEINVNTLFNKKQSENTEIVALKNIFQASMIEQDKKIQELTMQVASLTKIVNDTKTNRNTSTYTRQMYTQPQASGNHENYTCYFCERREHISQYCRKKLNKKYNQRGGNLNQQEGQRADAQPTLMDLIECVRTDSANNHDYRLPIVKFNVGAVEITDLVDIGQGHR